MEAGIIFDMDTPLHGLESYQGGLGARLSFYPSAVRALVDLQYTSTSGSLAVNLGAVYEYHFLPSPVSPYVGLSLGIGYLQQQPTALLVPLSAGVVVGAEVYVLDYLSVFAEYGISLDYTQVTDLQAQSTSTSWTVGTGMGNGGMIGVTLYFTPSSRKE